MAIELIKELDPKKVEAWDRIHDTRKLYRCERCGAEWKCEYGENKFRNRKYSGYNEDPNILCQKQLVPIVDARTTILMTIIAYIVSIQRQKAALDKGVICEYGK